MTDYQRIYSGNQWDKVVEVMEQADICMQSALGYLEQFQWDTYEAAYQANIDKQLRNAPCEK